MSTSLLQLNADAERPINRWAFGTGRVDRYPHLLRSADIGVPKNSGGRVGLADYSGQMDPQQGGDPRFTPPWVAPPQQRRPRFSWMALLALVVASAALVTAIIGLTRSDSAAGRAQGGPAAATPSSSTRPVDTAAANRALCTEIAPLMAESDKSAQAYSHLGTPNSPEWKPGAQTFVTDTKAWLGRMQPVIDSHGDADPFLLRSTQRFVDDLRYLVEDLESGPWEPYDQTIWNDSVSAVSGPLNVCAGVGVKW